MDCYGFGYGIKCKNKNMFTAEVAENAEKINTGSNAAGVTS